MPPVRHLQSHTPASRFCVQALNICDMFWVTARPTWLRQAVLLPSTAEPCCLTNTARASQHTMSSHVLSSSTCSLAADMNTVGASYGFILCLMMHQLSCQPFSSGKLLHNPSCTLRDSLDCKQQHNRQFFLTQRASRAAFTAPKSSIPGWDSHVIHAASASIHVEVDEEVHGNSLVRIHKHSVLLEDKSTQGLASHHHAEEERCASREGHSSQYHEHM